MSEILFNTFTEAVKESLGTTDILSEVEFNLVRNALEETPQVLNTKAVPTVNARAVWRYLESKQQFSDWIKARVEKYGFIEGVDYVVHIFMNNPLGGSHTKDYYVSTNMAKELGMVEGNAKGKLIRRYYIFCEELAKEQHKTLQKLVELEKAVTNKETYHINEKLKELELRLNSLAAVEKRKSPQKHPHRQSGKLIKFTQLCEYLESSNEDVRDFLLGHGLREMKDGAMIATNYSIKEGIEVIKVGRDTTGREYTWSLFTKP